MTAQLSSWTSSTADTTTQQAAMAQPSAVLQTSSTSTRMVSAQYPQSCIRMSTNTSPRRPPNRRSDQALPSPRLANCLGRRTQGIRRRARLRRLLPRRRSQRAFPRSRHPNARAEPGARGDESAAVSLHREARLRPEAPVRDRLPRARTCRSRPSTSGWI